MVGVLGEHGVGGYRYVAEKGLHEESAGNNCGVCSRYSDIQTFYRSKYDGGFQ